MAEYLVSHGRAGDFGRFRAAEPLEFRRGDSVIIRGPRGVEIGAVLCPATEQHTRMLDETFVGELLRPVTDEDRQIAAGIRDREQRLFDDARRLTTQLGLPLQVLDVEILLDGHQVTLYYLRWGTGDERPLVSSLSKKYETMVALRNLSLPAGASACGKPDCGNGGCTSCGTGGCSTCGKTMGRDVKDYFAGLRQKMEHQRVPLV